MKNSGIGGQAVIEGIMMRNKDKYSIAVRKPDQEIEVTVKECSQMSSKYPWLKYPIIRGIYSFIDSLVLGVSTISYSASFYDDPAEQKTTKADEVGRKIFKDKLEAILMAGTVLVSVAFAVILFMLVPYFISRFMTPYISSQFLLNFIEGVIRILIFIVYMFAISCTKDIKRTFMYHGAEHKCINCIEHGARLTPDNVMKSSRFHKRCGTSFMFLVMFVSVVFFVFIRVDNTALQLIIRLLLVPVIAGVSYELIRWAGSSNNIVINSISKPGLLMQKLTTKEPDMDMIEVAIKAVEEVFDWEKFLFEYYKETEDPEKEMAVNEALLDNSVITTGADKETRSLTPEEVKKTEQENKKEENVSENNINIVESSTYSEADVLEGFEIEEEKGVEESGSKKDFKQEILKEDSGIQETFDEKTSDEKTSDEKTLDEKTLTEKINEEKSIKYINETNLTQDDYLSDDIPVFREKVKGKKR